MKEPYSMEEEELLRGQLKEGEDPVCPRCGGPTRVTSVVPSPEVAYVRRRVRVSCPACRREAVLDRKPR